MRKSDSEYGAVVGPIAKATGVGEGRRSGVTRFRVNMSRKTDRYDTLGQKS